MNDSQSLSKAEQKVPQGGAVQPESGWHPLAALRNEVDRLFDSFWHRTGAVGTSSRGEVEPQPLWRFGSDFGFAVPSMDLVETEKEFRIKAELPGMEPPKPRAELAEPLM